MYNSSDCFLLLLFVPSRQPKTEIYFKNFLFRFFLFVTIYETAAARDSVASSLREAKWYKKRNDPEFQFLKILSSFLLLRRIIYRESQWIYCDAPEAPWKGFQGLRRIGCKRVHCWVELENSWAHVIHPAGRSVSSFNYYCALSEFCCHLYIYVQWAVNFRMGMANSSTTAREHTQHYNNLTLLRWDRFQTRCCRSAPSNILLSTFFIWLSNIYVTI